MLTSWETRTVRDLVCAECLVVRGDKVHLPPLPCEPHSQERRKGMLRTEDVTTCKSSTPTDAPLTLASWRANYTNPRPGTCSATGEHVARTRHPYFQHGNERVDHRQQTDTPAGMFSSVVAGSYHTCGLGESGEIACWGDNFRDQTDAPAGTYRSVSAGNEHTCAVRESGDIACWGWDGRGHTDPPAGTFRSVSVGYAHACAIGESGEVICWGAEGFFPGSCMSFECVGEPYGDGVINQGQQNAPTGTYRSVSLGRYFTCALREDGTVACWGGNRRGETDAPTGTFRSLSAGVYHTCAIRESGEVECWGWNGWGQTDAPPGKYRFVEAREWSTCGLRESGEIECWGGLGVPAVLR